MRPRAREIKSPGGSSPPRVTALSSVIGSQFQIVESQLIPFPAALEVIRATLMGGPEGRTINLEQLGSGAAGAGSTGSRTSSSSGSSGGRRSSNRGICGSSSNTSTSSGGAAEGLTAATGTNVFANAALNLLFGTNTRSIVSSSGSVVSTAVSAKTSGGSNSPGSATSSTTAGLALVSEGESLTILTTDGAQITVRFAAAGAGLMSQGSGSSDTAALSIGNVQVAVSGNLSSADTQAVSNVLSQVDALASQFFSGDAVDAFAAAASLNVDPSEIAGMSLNLTYTSNTFQATATSNSSAGSTQAGSAGSQSPVATSSVSGTLLGDSDSGDGASGDTESASASATSGAGNSSGTSDATASTTASNASPQQVITAFLQGVMGKLGRNTSIGGIHMSSSLKLQLLALAMPAYAQAQDTAQSVPTSIGAGISAPSATSTGASGSQPAQQGARLAAATLRQMAS
jgi:hypothetical protein